MQTDEELIISYKNGDEEAFKNLIDRYTPPLYNFIRRFIDRNYANDIVQETFIKVWKSIKKFDPEKASFKTWLFTIAKNTSTDFLRKKKSIQFSDLKTDDEISSFEETIPDIEPLAPIIIQRLQDKKFLEEVLEKLPIGYREVLNLYYQEELTFDEIGRVLDKPLNTVKSIHRRGLLKLRECIAPNKLI